MKKNPTTHYSYVNRMTVLFALFLAAMLTVPALLEAQHSNPAPVVLSTAGNFRVLSGTAVTNGAASTVTGDVGGTSVTNNGTITGTIYTVGATVTTALADLATAITEVSGRTADEAIAIELGGVTLGRGIYSSGTFAINGTLTLNGSASDIFIFQASSTLITGVTCAVVFTGGAVSSNVYWLLGSSATIDGAFKGVILASTAISQNTGTIEGKLLARDGAVTLTGSTTLPVELTSFTAAVSAQGTVLRWNTATETNNYGFEIERTIGKGTSTVDTWTNVGFVDGAGTTNSPKSYSYTDNALSSGTYSYRLKQIDRDGKFEYSNTIEATVAQTPFTTELMQNYPNPFNPTTQIQYVLAVPSRVSLIVYSMIGQEVATLVSADQDAGVHAVAFDAGSLRLSSGVYLYRFTAGDVVSTKRFTLLK
jgi:hypothetical protein